MSRAAVNVRKRERARARRVHLEIWPEPQEQPVMVRCDGCRFEIVNALAAGSPWEFCFPCVCGSDSAVYL